MKKKYFTTVVLTFITLIFSLYACKKEADINVVGIWEPASNSKDLKLILRFYSDSSFAAYYERYHYNGTYMESAGEVHGKCKTTYHKDRIRIDFDSIPIVYNTIYRKNVLIDATIFESKSYEMQLHYTQNRVDDTSLSYECNTTYWKR